ncbi:hypothetical protein AAC387_Pa09g1933 [Persea americana]
MVGKKTQILKSAFVSHESGSCRSFISGTCQNLENPVNPDDHIRHPIANRSQIPNLCISSLNSIISKFSENGDLVSARNLFDQMPDRDAVSWNSMMSAYAQNNQPDRVFELFLAMLRYDFKPNPTSLSVALSSCAKPAALNQGKQIHVLSIKSYYSANVFVGTSLITMYAKCKVFDCLTQVFDGINNPSLATWNALITGFVVNGQIEYAHQVFNQMPSRNIISWTALVNGYIKVRKVTNAFELFNSMPVKNSVSWSVMLNGFVYDGQSEKAIEFFSVMRSNGVPASVASVLSVISASSELKSIKQGRKIHAHAIKSRYDCVGVVEASLVLMYVKCLCIEDAKLEFNKMEVKFVGSWNSLIWGYINDNQVDEARRLFDEMSERDQVSWNSIINGYLGDNRIDDAVELFVKMPEPTVETRTALMSGFIDNDRLYDAKRLFSEMPQRDAVAYTSLIHGFMKNGLLIDAWELFRRTPDRNVVTYNVTMSGLIQHGEVIEAYKLFNESPERDVLSWNVMINGYVQGGFYDDAFQMYHRMILSDLSPSDSVLASLLSACSILSILSYGEQIHVAAIKYGFESSMVVINSLTNMYGKCGDMLKAKSIFDQACARDSVLWNTIICGYAVNGFSTRAIEMFENMKLMHIEPDHVTFLGILTACSHGGLMKESWHYFTSMRCDYGIVPRLAHYSCMVDLLCRIGLVEKAEQLIYDMPFQPDSVMWTSLLSGCKLTGNVEIAERAANQLFCLNSRDPMPYLHLIRIYGSAGRWADMENLRMKLNRLGLSKQPGCSWIEVNGEVSSFFAGDRSHSLSGEVQTHLRLIISEIGKLGYVPNYSLVIEDIEDQEKEEILMQHSEKLAVAFGLLRIPPPKPLRIFKNLRVCDDCHSAIKLISLCTRREIVLRDALRFHHFKGGSCSCSDYW